MAITYFLVLVKGSASPCGLADERQPLNVRGKASSIAVAPDGSVLATAAIISAGTQLFRLPPGATRWQALGPLPLQDGYLTCAPTGMGDALWALPQAGTGARNTFATALYGG